MIKEISDKIHDIKKQNAEHLRKIKEKLVKKIKNSFDNLRPNSDFLRGTHDIIHVLEKDI